MSMSLMRNCGFDVEIGDSWRRRAIVTSSAMVALLLLLTIAIPTGVVDGPYITSNSKLHSLLHRKLLRPASKAEETTRIWGEKCTASDIEINQGPTAPLPDGTPAYLVEILNVCATGWNISNIHVKCGWFSSVRLVNPRVFRRLYYDDCLVNNGEPLAYGAGLSFTYANTYLYPLSVFSVSC
ncbi:protein TAPETUM DETERMINANT 1-like [Punica granatum]|uniref:Protein TAPETUM DETERMINANT 1-like n=1 Tax=Punica granatum TaxID=22663 RepID=A0A218Y0N4_PUNGR|nr:protein TAPETUM DETERMINANT 1-like [Punica granatum]OWM90610.1 hypothetical protein CDL15_Pgr014913 [Punica granatum]